MSNITKSLDNITVILTKYEAKCISNYCDKIIQELEDYTKDDFNHCVVWDMRLEQFKKLKNQITSLTDGDGK